MKRIKKVVLITLYGIFLISCNKEKPLFEAIPSSHSGITFVNKVNEDSTHNVLEYMNFYTGAGVAAGDINNDGLVDLYFCGNGTPGKLYLNKGNFQFEDITEKAGLKTDRWETGVSMVDINNDGLLDIYINVAGSSKFGSTANLLYINNGDGTFTESAKKYGIADTRLTMNASFFDYDHDGYLDLFLITNPANELISGVNTITDRKVKGESEGTDILYHNNGNGTFTDVTKKAGISIEGYSLGASISDINGDGWPDIYVSNDFLTSDILYINNGDGTFTDKSAQYLKHTSFASMGNDIADINNDGRPDIITLDMLPEDNYRKKMIIPATSYDKFKLALDRGYTPQYSRNALQLNNGNGTFSDIGFLAGISSTDWSWSPLWCDFDNDGNKDLVITNGFFRDLGNLDYIHYQAKIQSPMGRPSAKKAEKLEVIKGLSSVPLHSYLFKNNGDLTFEDESIKWGLGEKGFGNGACYADLNNDGAMDLVINELNGEARIYKNNTNQLFHNSYLDIRLTGNSKNIQGIGAKAYAYVNGKMQFLEFNPYRGYESSVEPVLHFGFGKSKMVDSLKIIWPDGVIQLEKNVKVNQKLNIKYPVNAKRPISIAAQKKQDLLFTNITNKKGLNYKHVENEFDDFKVQPLLPHMNSQNGPGIAVGDINGDGLEDFYIGGALGHNGAFFIQKKDGSFEKREQKKEGDYEDMGVLLFDADGDGDLDLLVVSGGSENKNNSEQQKSRLYINDGKGNFKYDPSALPDIKISSSCVIAADYDNDGDLDLFIGGRVNPGNYPLPVKSHILRNDSKNGKVKFTDVTQEVCPELSNIGMVTSALWTDFNNDHKMDLVLTGEFMPVCFFQNNGKVFKNVTSKTGIGNLTGWWNTIVAGDFDEDGNIDYIVGNLGLNTRYKASLKEPLKMYAKDFDKNGLIDPIMCYYVQGKNYIYPTRDEMIKQINPMRVRFPTYESYARATFEDSFTPDELKDAYVLNATCFETCLFRNNGDGTFKKIKLPVESQFGPVFGLIAEDFNGDGHLDVLMTGNYYTTEASTGRYDAFSGLLLQGDGKGGFKSLTSNQTGFDAMKDSKGLALLHSKKGEIVLVANNDDQMESYQVSNHDEKVYIPNNDDNYAMVELTNGKIYKQEFYHGSNYLSSSSWRLKLTSAIKSISIFNNKGLYRTIFNK